VLAEFDVADSQATVSECSSEINDRPTLPSLGTVGRRGAAAAAALMPAPEELKVRCELLLHDEVVVVVCDVVFLSALCLETSLAGSDTVSPDIAATSLPLAIIQGAAASVGDNFAPEQLLQLGKAVHGELRSWCASTKATVHNRLLKNKKLA
jgi:hypothetical protein